jgi:predicted metal-dependent hydrolase
MVDYQIKRSSRSLNLRISINGQGQVVVSAPKLIPEFLIKKFVEGQRVWIEKNLQVLEKRQAKLDLDQLYIFDKKYQLQVDSNANKSEIKVLGEQLLLHSTVALSKKQIRDRLEAFFKKTAAAYILRKTPIIARQMEVSYQKISLRQQSSRWGSCSSRGNLNFNWRLVHYPPKVIDYVIIHELAHRIELNHSRRFWAIVRQYDPEYLLHKAALSKKRYNANITC